MSNVFNSVQIKRPPRNLFDMSFDTKFDCDMGQLIPISCEEVLPGDKYRLVPEVVVRTSPLYAPIYHNVKIKLESFFIPTRLIYDDWEPFITGGVTGKEQPALPLWDSYYNNNEVPPKYSLWDYFGFPLVLSNSVSDPNKDTLPIDFARRCYNLVWNEYYRDENIDEEVNLTNDSVLNRRWSKDYFTSSMPFPQRGDSPAIPVTGYGNVTFDGPVGLTWLTGSSDNMAKFPTSAPDSYVSSGVDFPVASLANQLGINGSSVSSVSHPYIRSGGSPAFVNDSNQVQYYPFVNDTARAYYTYNTSTVSRYSNGLNDNNLSLTDVGISISDLRLNNQIQEWMERSMIGGARYNEQCLAHFGVAPRDERVQRPQFLGSISGHLIVDEVLQTSTSQNSTPQGTLAGKGASAISSKLSSFFAPEHGYLLTLFSIVPQNGYSSQGIDKKWLKRTRFDYYFPAFAHLSEEPVKTGELYSDGTADTFNTVFGYQGIYNEYRHNRNKVCGALRDDLNIWHLNRLFSNAPSLNSSFIEINHDVDDLNRVFSVQNEPGFIVALRMGQYAIRPLPKYPTPSLFSHF